MSAKSLSETYDRQPVDIKTKRAQKKPSEDAPVAPLGGPLLYAGADKKLVAFLYILGRDYLPAGALEEVLEKHINGNDPIFTNGFLAGHSIDIARRLK